MEFPTATPVITFHLTPKRRVLAPVDLPARCAGLRPTLFDFTDALVAVHLGVGLVELRKDPDPSADSRDG